ncbi:unnamed protein product, partial [marine sediment metagenome]
TYPEIRNEDIPIKGRIPSSGVNLPPGCRFSPRCPYSDSCDDVEPELIEIEKDRFVMCHKVLKK